jgi:multidrug resistance efflux pump
LAGQVATPPLLLAQNVAAIPPKAAANTGYIECQGYVQPNRHFTLRLRPGEQLDAVMVAKGDHVKSGQPLARIEDPSLPARYLDLTARKNDYQQLRDDTELLTLELTLQRAAVQRVAERMAKLQELKETVPNYSIEKEAEPLIDRKFEIEDRIQAGAARLARLQARLSAQQKAAGLVEQELEAVRARIGQAVVKAPYAATVVERALDTERLTAGGVVCELWDESAFLIEVELLQHQLPYVQPGRTAIVAVDFARADSVRGVVDYLEPGDLIPNASRHPVFKAIVKIEKPVPWLRPGMLVAVRVRAEGAK